MLSPAGMRAERVFELRGKRRQNLSWNVDSSTRKQKQS